MDFSQQDFSEKNLTTADHMGKNRGFSWKMCISVERVPILRQSSPLQQTPNPAGAASLYPLQKRRSGEELLQSSRTMPQKFALRKIL
jgi:hypothetical protein